MLTHELTILHYHHIDIPPRGARIRGLYTTPDQFDWQLRQLQKRSVRFLTFDDLLRQRDFSGDEATWIILTFDDGTRGLYTHAFPVLQKHGIPAVIYPIVGDIGKESIIWEESTDQTARDMLTPEQIRIMAQAGIEFGSHFNQHVKATTLSPERLQYELAASKRKLEQILGREVLSVAYPFGSYSDRVLEAAKEAGYRFGVTTRPGSNIQCNLLELCRIPVKGSRWHHYFYFRRWLKTIDWNK